MCQSRRGKQKAPLHVINFNSGSQYPDYSYYTINCAAFLFIKVICSLNSIFPFPATCHHQQQPADNWVHLCSLCFVIFTLFAFLCMVYIVNLVISSSTVHPAQTYILFSCYTYLEKIVAGIIINPSYRVCIGEKTPLLWNVGHCYF